MIDRTMTSQDLPDWFNELLFIKSTQGLLPEQQQQFDDFVNEHPNRSHIESEIEKFELTVAAVDLSFQNIDSGHSPLPPKLREKIVDGANRFWEAERSLQENESELQRDISAPLNQPANIARQSGFSTREATAWLAAAAAVMLLLTGMNPFAFSVEAPQSANPTAKVETLNDREKLSEFVASLDEDSLVKQVDWKLQPGYPGGKGQVIWSDELQKGFMTFTGLPATDPSASRYQLWIFDEKRDQNYPVDGGVFDVNATGETVVEINAKLFVENAVMFAITEEDPDGAVVSTREKLPLLAKVEL